MQVQRQRDTFAYHTASAFAPEVHPDVAEAIQKFGVAHTSNQRYLPVVGRTAASREVQEDRLAKPEGWELHKALPPSEHAREGARAYNSRLHLPDPHRIDYSQIRRLSPDDVRAVGQHYDSLPMNDPRAHPHFEALRNEINQQYDHMTKGMGVRHEIVDDDPYDDIDQLMDDFHNNGRIKVLNNFISGLSGEGHPYFTPDEVNKFRAVHDLFGHVATGRGFDRHGEHAAWLAHNSMFTPAAQPALASEFRGQNSSLILNGEFPPAKAAIMAPQFRAPSALRSIPRDYAPTGGNEPQGLGPSGPPPG